MRASRWPLAALALGLLAGGAGAGPIDECGDGVAISQPCDDGNTVSGDGCSPGCLPEVCGDGILEPYTESCDDANTAPFDGCDASCELECGNGVHEPDEQCDDGNPTPGDGCDASCRAEVCGNGVLQPAAGEECDAGSQCEDGSACDVGEAMACVGVGDGECLPNRVDDTCDAGCRSTLRAQPDKLQQRCVNATNRGASRIAEAQNDVSSKCLAERQKGRVPDFDACILADARGKVGKRGAALERQTGRKCEPSALPVFAFLDDPAFVRMVAEAQARSLAQVLFGAPADPAIAQRRTDEGAARCQRDVTRRAAGLYDATLAAYDAAKAQAMKGTRTRPPVENAAELTSALEEAPAGSRRVAKRTRQLREKPARHCAGVDPAAAFPGACADPALDGVLACVARRVACQACLHVTLVDGLTMTCDLVDDAAENGSC